VVEVVPEYTARETPAASAVASPPPTRVVFLVAKTGKPRSVAADFSPPRLPTIGPFDWSPPPPPHPAAASASASRAAVTSGTGRGGGMGGGTIAPPPTPTRQVGDN
jgi:hypothetical protein